MKNIVNVIQRELYDFFYFETWRGVLEWAYMVVGCSAIVLAILALIFHW